MKRLSVKQWAMLDELASNKSDDSYEVTQGVELFRCSEKWQTAFALGGRNLVEI